MTNKLTYRERTPIYCTNKNNKFMKKVIFAIVIAGSVMLSSCGGSTTKCEVPSTDTTTVDSVSVNTVDTVKTK